MSEKVEILLATYNGELYLREQLESILHQDYQNWFVRVCDDDSTDGTFEILEEYKQKYPQKFVVEKNKVGFGSAKQNFMHLLKNSTCDYVMCCDQDDVWLPNKISVTLDAMKEKEEKEMPILVHTDLKVVDSNLYVLSDSFFEHSHFRKEFGFHEILIQNFVTGCTMMMNRPLVRLMNQIDTCDRILMHDWLAAILAAGCGKIAFVDKPTMLYRQHAINSVGAKKYGFALFWSKLKNAQMKKSLIDTTRQAAKIAEAYGHLLSKEKQNLICCYGNIWNKGKVRRIHFYFKYGVFKKGLPRKICQLIVG